MLELVPSWALNRNKRIVEVVIGERCCPAGTFDVCLSAVPLVSEVPTSGDCMHFTFQTFDTSSFPLHKAATIILLVFN